MKVATLIAQTLVRTLGPIQVILGLLFWTFNALNLIPVHMLIGLLIVLALWTLAGLGIRAGVHLLLPTTAIVWGVAVVILGMTQTQLLPGQFHWIIQLVHLGFGLGAIAVAEVLGRSIRATLVGARLRHASVAATP